LRKPVRSPENEHFLAAGCFPSKIVYDCNWFCRPGWSVDHTAAGPLSVLRSFKLSKKVYVGNLSFGATEEQVRDLFSEFGAIQSIAMINDRDTGRFRGFAFVEMEDSAANAAIKALNGKEVDGRELSVNEARPREERSGGGGGYRGGGGGRRNDYGDRNRDRNRNSW
jgi:RNA recognition motif-containing protein